MIPPPDKKKDSFYWKLYHFSHFAARNFLIFYRSLFCKKTGIGYSNAGF